MRRLWPWAPAKAHYCPLRSAVSLADDSLLDVDADTPLLAAVEMSVDALKAGIYALCDDEVNSLNIIEESRIANGRRRKSGDFPGSGGFSAVLTDQPPAGIPAPGS